MNKYFRKRFNYIYLKSKDHPKNCISSQYLKYKWQFTLEVAESKYKNGLVKFPSIQGKMKNKINWKSSMS